MTKVSRAIAAVGAAFLLFGGLTTASASPRPLVLTYSIREARAYAFKVSLSKQEIELIPPCDPTTDPYKCDTSQYDHKPNCPPQIAFGRIRPGPVPEPASESIVASGGAGDHLGEEPNQSSPVRLNRLLSLGRLGHSGSFPSAGGFASDQYVDLNGRQTPEAHTQSEAFSNLPDYEERCNPVPQSASSSYEHFLSRSGDGPATYHLSECFGSQCTFGAGISVEHARSVVDLHEKDGIVSATLQSELQGLDLVPGMLSADALSTYISVRSDGTPGGLKWSVATTLLGLKIAGQKVAVPFGTTIPLGSLTIGIVPPFVHPTDAGHVLSVVAPGLSIMSDAQSVFLGGAELYGSFDRDPAAAFNPLLPPIVQLPPIQPLVLPSAIQPPPPVVMPAAPPVAATDYAIRMYDTGQVAIALILAAGAAALLLLLARWSRRWAWGRRLCRAQPLKGIDWLYRAFVKT
jgi:hypothetical protein